MLKKLTEFVRENNLFVLVVILAALLRFVFISQNPPSLNWDEVSHGYNAYSIFKTGKDEWGKTLPIIFRAYGDYKLPVYIYLTAASEALFGLSAFAVRLTSVLAGVATVIFTYLLVNELFGYGLRVTGSKELTRNTLTRNKLTALMASLLVSIEPWSLFLSRGAFEANLALAFIVIGIYFFLKSYHSTYYLLLSTLFLGLSVWTYNSARIFVPIFLLILVVTYNRELSRIWKTNKKLVTCNLLLITFFFLPMFWQLLNSQGLARYSWVTILDEGAIAQINEARGSSSLNPSLRRVVYNKGTFFVAKFARNWASHFSGDFLFFKGGSNFQFSVPGSGILSPINLVFLILGIIVLIKKRKREAFLILAWFYFGPVAGSLTREAPHVLRAITMLPTPMIITAYGVITVWDKLRKDLKYVFLIGYLVVLTGFFENYLDIYFNSYRQNYSWSWQYGSSQVISYVKEHYGSYDKIIVTKKYGEPHEFFLFFWPWDPKSYQNDPNLIRFYQSNWYWVDRFDKFYFVNDWEIPAKGHDFVLESKGTVNCSPNTDRCLLITSPDNYPDGWNHLQTINFLDGRSAFEIYEN